MFWLPILGFANIKTRPNKTHHRDPPASDTRPERVAIGQASGAIHGDGKFVEQAQCNDAQQNGRNQWPHREGWLLEKNRWPLHKSQIDEDTVGSVEVPRDVMGLHPRNIYYNRCSSVHPYLNHHLVENYIYCHLTENAGLPIQFQTDRCVGSGRFWDTSL